MRIGFNSNFLLFLKNSKEYREFRENFINDAWKLIEYTEDNFNNNDIGYLSKTIDIISDNKLNFKVLTRYEYLKMIH